MSEQSPYEKLGLSEDASFDEIQDVRSRLLEQYNGDTKRLEMIEAAYDAILMERLKMRQEGKIKVPDRIRYPERVTQALPAEGQPQRQQPPTWLQTMLDKPTQQDLLLPGVWYLVLSTSSMLFYQAIGEQILQLALVLGIGVCIYFLNRKEGKFGRSVLLTLLGLITGLIGGGFVAGWITPQIQQFINLAPNQFSTLVAFVLLWLIGSFLK